MTSHNEPIQYAHKYLFVVRANLNGVRLSSWYEITDDDTATKGVLFGMAIASKVNQASGICLVNSDDVIDPNVFEIYIQDMSRDELITFLASSLLKVD